LPRSMSVSLIVARWVPAPFLSRDSGFPTKTQPRRTKR
jgi:hypothetical protein